MTPNRSEPTSYKVVRVRFKDGRPDGSYEKFLTGFWISGQHRAEWGRPAALAVMKDGSLLIADDTGGTIWRVSYTGTRNRETTTGTVPALGEARRVAAWLKLLSRVAKREFAALRQHVSFRQLRTCLPDRRPSPTLKHVFGACMISVAALTS
jgi:hypothetical protein